ncbi:hypothetical protein QBC39DRAFT_306838 [Podospora conica]|nr:hypothetical protein QBC39DRAFT_306838 [Schizothecium conicum]
MVSFLDLPAELRHEILWLAIATPKLAPWSPVESQDRVRLRDEWDVWVPAVPPEPAVLPFMLTCRTMRYDILAGRFQQSIPYELDVMFLPGCGLWPTWTLCPSPRQLKLSTLRVVFRIFDPQTQVMPDPPHAPSETSFTRRFPAISRTFNINAQYPNPPPGAWNFYRLLISLLSLGPRGLVSRAAHRARRGSLMSSPPLCTVDHLVVALETQPPSSRWSQMTQQFRQQTAQQQAVLSYPDLPYGCLGDETMFPGLPAGSGHEWSGRSSPSATQQARYDDADRLGMWLANAMWALLKFGRLSRAFGLVVFEGIVESIVFWVDGERRRPWYNMRAVLAGLPYTPMRDGDMDALLEWREWLYSWRASNGEGQGLLPRPMLAFPRYLPVDGNRQQRFDDT